MIINWSNTTVRLSSSLVIVSNVLKNNCGSIALFSSTIDSIKFTVAPNSDSESPSLTSTYFEMNASID